MTLTTPALLFPAISLLFLSYNNRFLALAHLIRNLHAEYMSKQSAAALQQIVNLRYRLRLIQVMEFLGVLAFVLCVFCMLLLLGEWTRLATGIFVGAVVSLMASLVVALMEIYVSIGALKVLLAQIKTDL